MANASMPKYTVPSELDETYLNSILFDLPEHPHCSKEIRYLREIKRMLEKESEKQNKDLVIGFWSRPRGAPGKVNYGFYEKEEAIRLLKLSKTEQFSVDPYFGGFYDKSWFNKRIKMIKLKTYIR